MSHFTTVKTELRKIEPLIQALHNLGYIPEKDEQMIQGYRGQTVKADLAVKVKDSADIGFCWNKSTQTYELVADLDLWKQNIPVERFVAKLTQQYALNTVLSATKEEGFQVSEQKNHIDGSIELVVTRWD